MSGKVEIRDGRQSDAAALEALYPQAFPDEDLLPLVRDLAYGTATGISLVAAADSLIVGHAVFTRCGVEGDSAKAALLGPVAVVPDWQGRGIGSVLIRAGLKRMKIENVCLVCVLGDPAYYGRLGFMPETLVEPPFPLPVEWTDAWQSQYLSTDAAHCVGKLVVPPAWMRSALWAP